MSKLDEIITAYVRINQLDLFKGSMGCEGIIVYGIPRLAMKSMIHYEKIFEGSGLYFLFGVRDVTEKPFVYVGASRHLRSHLRQEHRFELDNVTWSMALVFMDSNRRISYDYFCALQQQYCYNIKEFGNYELMNLTENFKPIPIDELFHIFTYRITIDSYLHHYGYNCVNRLRPLTKRQHPMRLQIQKYDDPRFHIYDSDEKKYCLDTGENKKIMAYFIFDEYGFHILKGAHINLNISHNLSPLVKQLRIKYDEAISEDGILLKDVLIRDVSCAASFVRGENTDGMKSILNSYNQEVGHIISYYALRKPMKLKESTMPIIFRIVRKDVVAYGEFIQDYFVLKKGSIISKQMHSSCPKKTKNLRKLYSEFIDEDNTVLEDIYFETPSTAACFVLNQSASGYRYWLDENQKTITEVNEERIARGVLPLGNH